MPNSVYRMDHLEEAKSDARINTRAITIIFTHEKTSCGLCEAASLKAAATLSNKTVVVYADANTEWGKLPPAVQDALRTPEAGPFVPQVVILDLALTKVLAIVPYATSDRYDQLLQAALKKLPDSTSSVDVKK